MFPASRFSASRFSSHLRLHGLCFLGRPALPCPESPQSRAVRHAAAAAARCSVQPDCRGGRALSAPPETPYFRPASAPTGPPRAGPAFPLRKTHAVHAVPRTAVAAARRRGRRPPRAIAEFAAAQPKMPAALCAPAAGGRRRPHAFGGGGGARRTGTCPLSLSPPPPPAFAPPPAPATAGAPARLCRRALRGRLLHARPAGGSRLPPPKPVGAWCQGLQARRTAGVEASQKHIFRHGAGCRRAGARIQFQGSQPRPAQGGPPPPRARGAAGGPPGCAQGWRRPAS